MVENINTSNFDKKEQNEKRPYDPILDDPISDSEEEKNDSEEASESSEEEVEFPRQNATDLLNFVHRELTNLSNMEDAQ